MKMVRTTYLSLGSNKGNKLKVLQSAIDLIGNKIGQIKSISSVYLTKSWGFEGKDFLNICIEVSTNLNPALLIEDLLQIELQLGRKRKISNNYMDRNIDIDILLFDDNIISYYNLKVPHPKMLERSFVLVPLNEIAPNTIHPIAKKNISYCLQNCEDTGDIEKTTLSLNQQISLREKYNYIAIEGNIGSGKTSLSTKMADDFNAKLILEQFADNPFLPKFFKDKEQNAFPLEMSFLVDRHEQHTDNLSQLDLINNFIISDYYIFKSLIFAQINLSKEEYHLYKKIFNIMYKEIHKPDIYVYLHQNTDRLLENIKKRGRDFEQNINPDYLKKIHNGYMNFMNTYANLNSLIIDVTELDLVNNEVDYQFILKEILDHNNDQNK